MHDLIKRVFTLTEQNSCLQTITKAEFHIYDDTAGKKQCYIQDDPIGVKHFTVENPAKRSIHFLAIDHCLLFDGDSAHCDCAVFDEKTFCFIEIKETTRPNKRAEYTHDAKEQLKATILYFNQRLTFTTKRIEAYVCVSDTSPRPARPSNNLNEQVEFADLKAILYHGNIKRFAP